MKPGYQGKIILAISIPLAILVTVVSCIGIFTDDFYARESFNWQVQSLGQDRIDLYLIIPVLIGSAIFAYRKSHIAALLWAGTLLYVIYTFTIYCFDIHFNRAFIVYCFILGLSFYSFLWFIYAQVKSPAIIEIGKKSVTNVTGIYFLILLSVFYFLWLSEIIPAIIENTVPKSLKEIGLFTNPIQVIDLSVFLPGIFMTVLLVLKRKPLGFLFTLIMLTFFILMSITISWLAFAMNREGLESDLSVTVVMAALALTSFILLIWNIKNSKIK